MVVPTGAASRHGSRFAPPSQISGLPTFVMAAAGPQDRYPGLFSSLAAGSFNPDWRSPPSQADLDRQSAPIDELQSVIAERDEDLEAVRRLNADLTRRLSQSGSIRNPSDSRSCDC